MIRFKTALGICLSFGFASATFAAPASQPDNSQPATNPSVAVNVSDPAPTKADQPAVDASNQPSADRSAKASAGDSKFPTPAELMARMKQVKDEQSKIPQVAYFNLDRPITEKPAEFSLFGGPAGGLTLNSLLDRLDKAKADKDIRAVLITMGDSGLNLSQALELRSSLENLRREGKKIFVYADSYDSDSYVAACGATDICLLQGGEIEIPGVGFQTLFAKGLMDKLGVKGDYVQIGEYKGADEEYTRTEPSVELNGQLNALADGLYQQIIDNISMSRNLSTQDVKQLVDDSLIPANIAKDRGLVDHLVAIDDLRDLIGNEVGNKIDLVSDYGAPAKESVDMSSPLGLLMLLSKKPEVSSRPTVALVYAEGEIVDGSGGQSLTGSDSVGSDDIREAFRMAERDDKVEAIVLRIDSPGGSALASEAMWQAVRRVAKTKPVIISVGSMAASGGYYLASSGDYIIADPSAIVGSIGVVGGKFVIKDLLDKLGLNIASFTRGRNADLFSMTSEWDDRQRRQVTQWMHDTYDMFTQRVMTTRTGKIKDIDAVARGRIFTAKQAQSLGMVDAIGGMQSAVEYAAGKADLRAGEYDVRVFPPARTIADILSSATGADFDNSRSPIAPKIEISPESLLSTLPPDLRNALGEELEMMKLLQAHPVVLMSPYVMIQK